MAKAIMIQGTMSNVGKSFLTAGLCRIFKQDGYRAAPFKAQNMALNSYVTSDGLEIGRAQAMQAEAAGIEPDIRMNPILLKPTGDIGSQVIVNGSARCNMPAREYFEYKLSLLPEIQKAYDSLSREYDIMVIEGAGSPAEINLKENDIVNMGMARLAGAPVLLVGDIDRGGVFAQLLGTVDLLEQEEREYVKGLIVNKFRGDRSILQPGLDMLEGLSGKDVIGAIPYIRCHIDDEDGLSLAERPKTNKTGLINIAAIRLPRISNFTDLAPFERMDKVKVSYIETARALKELKPDLIIIPGTKNTVDDLLWIREQGIEAVIKQYAAEGGAVFGICGGYQMLGLTVTDSYGWERKGEFKGMGLLPVETRLEKTKTLVRSQGRLVNIGGIFADLQGCELCGYEIHTGATRLTKGSPMCLLNEGNFNFDPKSKLDGAYLNNVYGSYLHGIFDSEEVSGGIIAALMKKKGVEGPIETTDTRAYKEEQYNILASAVRESLDMAKVYKILEEGVYGK